MRLDDNKYIRVIALAFCCEKELKIMENGDN
jgi:hypothetical protein